MIRGLYLTISMPSIAQSWRDSQLTRQHGINVHKVCQGLGIRVRPVSTLKYDRQKNTIYGGRTIGRLIRSHGEDHVTLVLRCIQVSSPDAFFGDVILAVHRYIAIHRAKEAPASLLVDFRHLDLPMMRQRARRLSQGMTRQADALSILIANQLDTFTEDRAA
jgi:hypothetical protein